MGASPTLLVLKSTDRTSGVSSSTPVCILRQIRRFEPPCLRASHSPSPSTARQGMAKPCPERGFDACAIDQKGQRAGSASIRQVYVQTVLAAAQGAIIGHILIQADQPQPALYKTGCLPERHPEQHLHFHANLDRWIAASPKLCWRPGIPLGGGTQTISGSNQIDSKPRCFNAVLHESQFLVLYFVGAQLLMPLGYHPGIKQ